MEEFQGDLRSKFFTEKVKGRCNKLPEEVEVGTIQRLQDIWSEFIDKKGLGGIWPKHRQIGLAQEGTLVIMDVGPKGLFSCCLTLRF